jgi:thaumarchaeosortase
MTIALKERIKKTGLDVKIFLSKVDWRFFSQIALVFAAFIVPLVILYGLDSGSFDYLWKGRAPYFLFLWLFVLEAALGWKKLKKQQPKFWTKKTVLSVVTLLLPTIYAVGLLIFDLQLGIVELGRAVGVPIINGDTWYLTHSWPFSFEYVLFAVFFVASIWLLYGVQGLKTFSVSAFFIGGVGVFYMIDTFYPNGTFTALQSLVPITTHGVAAILNLLGYTTEILPAGQQGLSLEVSMGGGEAYKAIIAWSCAGSHSLFLYSFMIMLFLRGTSISRMRKLIYVALGAAGTFFVNILRIVTIYVIGINSGDSPAKLFHEFYGELFFIAWMFIYLTIVFLLETRVINKFSGTQKREQTSKDESQPTLTQ